MSWIQDVYIVMLCTVFLILFYLFMSPRIWFTQEVSLETNSGKKTATFLFELNYVFMFGLYCMAHPLYLGIQGCLITASLMVALPVWMKQNSNHVKRDQWILDCKDCYKQYIKDRHYPWKDTWTIIYILSIRLCIPVSSFLRECFAFGYHLSIGYLIGIALLTFQSFLILLSRTFSSYGPINTVYSKWYSFDISVETLEQASLLFIVRRLKCRHRQQNNLSIIPLELTWSTTYAEFKNKCCRL